MITIEHTTTIERPIEEVWAFVADPANDPQWQTTLTEIRQVTEGAFGLGTKVTEVRRFLGRRIETTWEVTEYEPPVKSVISSSLGPIQFRGGYLLQSAENGTSFTIWGDVEAGRFFSLTEPVLARIFKRELEANLGHLKDLLEAGIAAAEPVEAAAATS